MKNIQPVTTTVAGAKKITGLSTSTIYRLFNEGELTKIKVKNRTLIRVSELVGLIERAAKNSPTEGGV